MVKYEFGKLSSLGVGSYKQTKKRDKKRQYEFGKPSKLTTSLKKGNAKIKADITPAKCAWPVCRYEKERLPKFGKNTKHKKKTKKNGK